jgi:hypothetical protein
MMRLSAVRYVGGYRDQYNSSEDLDLWLRLAEIGRIANLPEVLIRYRRHYASVCHGAHKQQAQQTMKRQIVTEAFQRRGRSIPPDWKMDFWQPKDQHEQILQWGWRALKTGHLTEARRHAWDALKLSPLSTKSWRLMYCARRGR